MSLKFSAIAFCQIDLSKTEPTGYHYSRNQQHSRTPLWQSSGTIIVANPRQATQSHSRFRNSLSSTLWISGLGDPRAATAQYNIRNASIVVFSA
jgi:hypothetical protein